MEESNSPHLGTVTTTQPQQTNHAEANATSKGKTIEALYELHCWDADTATPLTDEAKSILADLAWSNDGSSDDAFQEAVTQYVQETPLSVQVRSDWHSPGETFTAGQFEILLSTGGPACRIIGELDRGLVAWQAGCRPVIQHQDWFKPWTESTYNVDTNALVWFCEQFYYGE